MKQYRIKINECGVSEALGFMLIFSLVIVGIGLVTLYGYPMLIQQQTSADEQIMEKNMIVLQNDVKGIAYKAVPYKETALKIGGGTLFSYNPIADATAPKFAVWDGISGYGSSIVSDYQPGELRYESDSAQTRISLQNGAVVMRKNVESGSVMLAEPRWFFDEATNTMVVPLIALNNTDTISRTGIGAVQMKMLSAPEIITSNALPGGTAFYVMYDPGSSEEDYSVAWNNYFTNTLGMTAGIGCPASASANARCYEYVTGASKDAYLVIKKFEVTIQSL